MQINRYTQSAVQEYTERRSGGLCPSAGDRPDTQLHNVWSSATYRSYEVNELLRIGTNQTDTHTNTQTHSEARQFQRASNLARISSGSS